MNRTMSPFELEVILHYYYTSIEMATESRSLLASTIAKFIECELLEQFDEGFNVTKRGKTYIEAILALPLPEDKS